MEKIRECLIMGFTHGLMSLLFLILPIIPIWTIPLIFVFLFVLGFSIPYLGEGGSCDPF